MMKKITLIILLLVFVICGHAIAFTHTAALAVGETKEKVLSYAEHMLGEPIDVYYADQGTSHELELRVYAFTNVYDLVLYFCNNIFFQAGLAEPGSKVYPDMREDYKEVRKGSPGPAVYLLKSDGKNSSIETLWQKER